MDGEVAEEVVQSNPEQMTNGEEVEAVVQNGDGHEEKQQQQPTTENGHANEDDKMEADGDGGEQEAEAVAEVAVAASGEDASIAEPQPKISKIIKAKKSSSVVSSNSLPIVEGRWGHDQYHKAYSTNVVPSTSHYQTQANAIGGANDVIEIEDGPDDGIDS